jgi:hypothetical protein
MASGINGQRHAVRSWSLAHRRLVGAPLFCQVNQHINGAMEISVRMEQRRRIGQEFDARAIGPFSDSLDASYSAPLPHRNCHGALIVRKDTSRFGVELPCDAPPIPAEARGVPCKRYAGSVIVDDHASSVRDVNGYWKGIQGIVTLTSCGRRQAGAPITHAY